MLKGVPLFSEELAPCVAENRVRFRSLPTTYRPFNKLRAARPGLGIECGGSHPLGDRGWSPDANIGLSDPV